MFSFRRYLHFISQQINYESCQKSILIKKLLNKLNLTFFLPPFRSNIENNDPKM